MSSVNGHDSKGDFLVKAPTSTTAGVQPQNTIPLLTGILVGVSVNHHIRVGQIWRNIPLVVNQEEMDMFNGKCEALRQPLRPVLVVVPSDNIERGVLPELVHNGLGVDIAAVDDDVSLGQVSHHLRPQKAVGIG